jgi:hypothetical protein
LVTITYDTYSHVIPGMAEDATSKIAALLFPGTSRREEPAHPSAQRGSVPVFTEAGTIRGDQRGLPQAGAKVVASPPGGCAFVEVMGEGLNSLTMR